jgi:hypothetical protein
MELSYFHTLLGGGGNEETANVSEMYVCHLHFACEISHNSYLQSPVFTIHIVPVSKSCKHLQYIQKYYTCLYTKDSHICETE